MGEIIQLIVLAYAGVGFLVVLGIAVDLGMRRDRDKERADNEAQIRGERWD